MFAYMFAHEAHHRGQILILAHQAGYRVLDKAPHIWQWEKFWKQAGLARARAEWTGKMDLGCNRDFAKVRTNFFPKIMYQIVDRSANQKSG